MSDATTARTVTAFFDTKDHAETARTDLIATGVADADVTVVGSGSDHFTVEQDHHQGFWAALTNWFIPEDDRRVYAEGLRRGGFAVSVRCEGILYDKAIDVLDRDGAIDLDERATDWSKDGWSPSVAGDAPSDVTPYRAPDNGTAGFGGSYAGEDGLARDASQPGVEGLTPAHATAPTPATSDGVARVTEAENNDVRERIGVGSANWMAPNPTGGPQTYANAATPADDAASDAVTGKRPPPDPVFSRRDTAHGRSRVRSYIVDNDVNR